MAEYALPVLPTFLTSFKESILFSGGLPLFIMKNNILGLPQRQMVYPATPFVAVQKGSAVGYKAMPGVPGSIWPQWLKESPIIEEMTPERYGPNYQKFGITWSYTHESPLIMVGVPHLWVG